jgi:uncharacterized protein
MPARVLALLLLVVLGFGAPAQAADPQFPALTGRVVDQAELLSAADESEITAELEKLEGTSTDQLVVVTLPSLQGYDIADYGYRLGRHWGIGQQDKDNGVLLIVAPNERLVRIEVGRGLEGTITDGLASGIIQNRILPQFRRGDFPGGIKTGVTDIRDALLGDVEEVRQRAVGGGSGGQNETDYSAMIFMAIWLTIMLFIVWRAYRRAKEEAANPALRKRRRSGVVVFPSGGSSGGWGSGGGWSGGGGFGGGGGGFGGGGSSGSW